MRTGILIAIGLMSFACTRESTPDGDGPGVAAPAGELSLELLGADRDGQPYRLRSAIFDIAPYYYYPGDDGGSQVVTVSSDTEPNATTIRTRLLPAFYTVTLRDPGWFLEKVTATGAEPVAQSVLLSPATQYADVYDRGTTSVNYAFGVDGTLIDFRHGNLDIGISIERPDDGGGVVVAPDGGGP